MKAISAGKYAVRCVIVSVDIYS